MLNHANEKLIEKYTQLGVFREKINITPSPAVCVWSISKKCLVWVSGKGENGIYELIKQNDGNYRLSYENNRMVPLSTFTIDGVDVGEINNSEGIIITDATYGNDNHYRFAIAPTE